MEFMKCFEEQIISILSMFQLKNKQENQQRNQKRNYFKKGDQK